MIRARPTKRASIPTLPTDQRIEAKPPVLHFSSAVAPFGKDEVQLTPSPREYIYHETKERGPKTPPFSSMPPYGGLYTSDLSAMARKERPGSLPGRVLSSDSTHTHPLLGPITPSTLRSIIWGKKDYSGRGFIVDTFPPPGFEITLGWGDRKEREETHPWLSSLLDINTSTPLPQQHRHTVCTLSFNFLGDKGLPRSLGESLT